MRRRLAYVFMLCAASVAVAKPGQSACENTLSGVRAAIEGQNLLWISAHDRMLSLILFPPELRDARARKAGLIRDALKARSLRIAAFSTAEVRRDAQTLTDVTELNTDKTFEHFATAHVLIIDSVEDFVSGFNSAEREANQAVLRRLLSERVRNRRPSILTLDDVTSAERYLRELSP